MELESILFLRVKNMKETSKMESKTNILKIYLHLYLFKFWIFL